MNKFKKSLETYLQSQISKVIALIKASKDRIERLEEDLKEEINENTKRKLSILRSEEMENRDLLWFRLDWLTKQIRILEDEMNGDTE
jgi:hypothetical protein